MSDAIRITADEINCLIYAYLKDSGFTHSAFAIRMESQLERSPLSSKHIPRGELIDLLSKSLLYIEVESHWRGDTLASNCKSPFSLLEPHVCSLEPPSEKPSHLSTTNFTPGGASMRGAKTNGAAIDSVAKRKTSPVSNEGPVEKRAKKDSDDMELDGPSESLRTKVSSEVDKSTNSLPESISKKTSKPKPLTRGPGDDITNPKAILLLPGHRTEVFVCAFNPVKPQLLATGSKDAVVNLWNLPNPPPGLENFAEAPASPVELDYLSKSDQGDLTSLHWNSDGSLVAVGSFDSVLRICTAEGSLYFSHRQHQGPIFSTRFSNSGQWLLSASLDGTACLWDVKEKRLHKQYMCHTDCCLDVDWLDENTFATCGADQLIHILRVDEASPVKTLRGHNNEINQIKCNPEGTRLASCSDDMTARIWNVQGIANPDAIPGFVASTSVVILEGHKHSVSTIGWCPDRTLSSHPLIATSSFDGTARLWDSVSGDCLKILSDHRRPVYALSFSPDGYWLATGSGDGWLYVYNVLTQEKRWSWYAGLDRPGVFEIDWQAHEGINRIALALECREVAVIDVSKIPALNNGQPRRTGSKPMHVS